MAIRPNIVAAKVNVLVYSGNGAAEDSVRHCLSTLRRLLAGKYAVIPMSTSMLLNEPWMSSCALLVMPGGADLPYCRALNGVGNRRISQFVEKGGAYLGFCAGGYYGSARCEFEVGDSKLEVVGDRELAFFPGTCRGCAFKGFVYESVAGARAARLAVSKGALTVGNVPETFRSYYNGGGVFVNASEYSGKGVEVLASYEDDIDVNGGDEKAAAVYRRIEEGAAILMAVHPEYAPASIDKSQGGPEYAGLVHELIEDDGKSIDFLKACLAKLGLRVNQEQTAIPSLSELHLSASNTVDLLKTAKALREIARENGDDSTIKDERDTLRIVDASSFRMDSLKDALPEAQSTGDDSFNIVKTLVVHEDLPTPKETPYFSHENYYASLEHYQRRSREGLHEFGSQLIYAEVLPSTQTLLEKNPRIMSCLPSGFTATTTLQVAGKGRGSNTWVSSPGQLTFSTVIRHPAELMARAPVVFIQYLAALAVIQGITGYDKGYEKIPVKMKWPNDVYALDPTKPGDPYTKICGILVNANYAGGDYIAVSGIGVNALNTSPTTSLGVLVDHIQRTESVKLAPLSLEKLLASILTRFESLHKRFLRTGFDETLERMYYDAWLHTDQIVTLETEGGVKAKIRGITRDYGLLKAEELGFEDRPTGRMFTLQSDSNSFDFLKRLVRRKL
ncbi:biotin holocarboxylase synthetase [Ascosphaera pollenicola]|nr:biotin holocarboxylase synthetase [Ascosphaera pollenicola]